MVCKAPHPKELALDHGILLKLLRYNPKTGLFTAACYRPGRQRPDGVVGYLHATGYRRIYVIDRHFQAHRLAWFYVHKRWPRAEIDHINGNRDDNRIINLREATASQNQANTKARLRALPKGVYKIWGLVHSVRYYAAISINRKVIHLGSFDTVAEARCAYKNAATKYFGEFARMA